MNARPLLSMWPVGDGYSSDGIIALIVLFVVGYLGLAAVCGLLEWLDGMWSRFSGVESFEQRCQRIDAERKAIKDEVLAELRSGYLFDLLTPEQQEMKVNEETDRLWLARGRMLS